MAILLVWLILNKSIPWLVKGSVLQMFLGILATYVWSWHILVGYEHRYMQQSFSMESTKRIIRSLVHTVNAICIFTCYQTGDFYHKYCSDSSFILIQIFSLALYVFMLFHTLIALVIIIYSSLVVLTCQVNLRCCCCS